MPAGPSEFERIRRFLAAFDVARPPRGPGDDCAVLPVKPGTELCVTTDAIVEGVHFTRTTFSPEDIGHKALAVNLSDLASMGAKPAWFLCAVAHPADFPLADLLRIAKGMSAEARAAGIRLAGGNFTRADQLSLTITAAGTVKKGKALTRSGARPGDLLFVSGTLGDARLGLQDPTSEAAKRQRRPIPRLKVGQLAAKYATAAIDLSDGLAQDLGHLCEASKVGAQLHLDQLPTGQSSKRDALAGGEDYELLLTVPSAKARALQAAARRAGEQLTQIGAITREGRIAVTQADGRAEPLPKGFDHFRNAPAKPEVPSALRTQPSASKSSTPKSKAQTLAKQPPPR